MITNKSRQINVLCFDVDYVRFVVLKPQSQCCSVEAHQLLSTDKSYKSY